METTLNVDIGILTQITRASKSRGISRSELITILIKKVMNENIITVNMGKLVKYQKKSSLANWHTFHLNLREDDYEYFLDLRKLFKMSVSLILAYAVEKYLIHLDEINTADNYRFRNYVIVKEVIENIICWRYYWGYPPNLHNHL
jgi:hypothetical protein